MLIAISLIGTVGALSCASTSQCPDRTQSYHVSLNVFDMSAESQKSLEAIDAFSVSVSFDPEREEFVYINGYAIDDGWEPDVNTINTNYHDETVTDPGFQGKTHLAETVEELKTYWPYYVQGAIANNVLYLGEYYGRLLAVDLETREHDVVNYVDVVEIDPDNLGASVGSVCIDEEVMMAYVVDYIGGAVYEVDIGNSSAPIGGWSVETIHAVGSTITDINGANPRAFKPTDCTVVDGKVYMSELADGDPGTGALGIYDIEAETFMYDSDILSSSSHAITSSNGILVVVSTALEVYIYDCCDSEQTAFVKVATATAPGTPYAFQATIDWINGVIAVAINDQDVNKGYLAFVQSDDLIYTPPTTAPTAVPTKSPSEPPTEMATTIYAGTEETEVTGVKGDNAAFQCRCNVSYILLIFGCTLFAF